MTGTQPLDPTDAFARLGRIKLADTDIDNVLKQVADLAQQVIPGAAEVSVTLLRGDDVHTAAFTGDLALILDEWQYEYGHGPCLAAAATGATVSVPDMVGEQRWPDWSARADRAGARSSLSIGLPVDETVTGALNVYASASGAFDDEAITVAESFAGYAAVAVANVHLYDTQATLAQHMQAAMEHRAVIEQAKGILMGQRRCTADEAFAILRKLSQDTNRKVRDVAAALVASSRERRTP